MAGITLEDLPVNIQTVISEDLWQTSPSSILTLAATSQSLKEAVTPFLYRDLVLRISTRAKIIEDVERLRTTDVGQLYLRYARHIKLEGCMVHSEPVPVERDIDEEDNEEDNEEPMQLGTKFALEENLNPMFNEVFVADAPLDHRDLDAAAWEPFISVIGEFQHLTDMVWECHGRFAPGLMDALHQHHPDCKLHLRRFRFLSLHEPTTDPDELAIVNSPCLHSLSVLAVWRDSRGRDDHNEDAALRVLTAAPNLKHFRLLGARPASSPALHNALRRPKQAWAGFKPEPEHTEKSSLLTFATCCYRDDITVAQLATWDQHFTFRSLEKVCFAVFDANVLTELTTREMLASLKDLSITLKRNKDDDRFEAAAEAFFHGLPPLQSLQLHGTIHRDLLTTICSRHGPTLHELTLKPYEDHYDMAGPPLMLGAEDVELIGQSCPQLKHINLQIKRTQGDNRETRCYEAMRKLNKLKSVWLHLDCSNARGDPMNMTMGGGTPSQIERALINSAVDESLVRAIWDIIAGSEADSCLEWLQVSSGGGSSFGRSHPGDLMTIVNHISRSYTLTRKQDGGADAIEIDEISKRYREQSDDQQRKHEQTMLEKWGHKGLTGTSFEAMERLWSLEPGHGNWREAWKSFPLQRST